MVGSPARSRDFLQGPDHRHVDKLGAGRGPLAALLTPQGKIPFDFIVFEAGGRGGDSPRVRAALAEDLAKRSAIYRLGPR